MTSHHPGEMSCADARAWFRAVYDTPLLLAGLADVDGVLRQANRAAVETVGYARADVLDRPLWDGPWWRGDADVRAQVRAWLEQAAAGAVVRGRSRWWTAEGEERHVELAVHGVSDPDEGTRLLFVSGTDVTESVGAAHAAAGAAHALQAAVGAQAQGVLALESARAELATSLELSRHILDNVADGIYGLTTDLVAHFVNPAATTLTGYPSDVLLGSDVHALLHRTAGGGEAPRDSCPAMQALRTGSVSRSDTEWFQRVDGTLVPVEVLAVPVLGEGRVTGVVVSFRDLTERLLARRQSEELAALERREQAQRELSNRLQQAMLTPPPRIEGLEVVVRYRPAARDAQVGGDWYDVFRQPDGSTVLVVGDVVGHDSTAAGAMGELRGLLRGLAYGCADGPGRLLGRLEETAAGLGVQALATALVARVAAAGPDGSRRVTWASAGHPPPLLLDARGTAHVLPSAGDLLLGVALGPPRAEREVVVPVGSGLLLFTDGLVERRGEDIDRSLERLAGDASGLLTGRLEAGCDALLDRVLHLGNEDDVVLLTLRVLPAGAPPATPELGLPGGPGGPT